MLLAGVISMAFDSSTSPRVPPLRSACSLDLGDRRLGLLFPPVHEQPARALGKVLAHEQDDETKRRAEQEGHPPRVADRQVVHDQEVSTVARSAPPQ